MLQQKARTAYCKRDLVPTRKQVAYKLELKVIFLTSKEFQNLCSDKIVLITTDNTSVVAYINKEGVMTLRPLCALLCLPDLVLKETGTIFIRINAPGAIHFSKGGATIKDKKHQLSSPVELGDNGHLQPSSRFPPCIIARKL